ncbi:hypothetical protein LX32DRAFT_640638 [Colletotrichum zoysiae]|uniref:Secreted protein n=1 Tax=Colletotrichum zoysiae TaxID=1216348 RepID=A0AAD9HH03_9PEZI|nr:hypothetical protein LX32DRAFT_640638 [Colletotrichum zoysiae]
MFVSQIPLASLLFLSLLWSLLSTHTPHPPCTTHYLSCTTCMYLWVGWRRTPTSSVGNGVCCAAVCSTQRVGT